MCPQREPFGSRTSCISYIILSLQQILENRVRRTECVTVYNTTSCGLGSAQLPYVLKGTVLVDYDHNTIGLGPFECSIDRIIQHSLPGTSQSPVVHLLRFVGALIRVPTLRRTFLIDVDGTGRNTEVTYRYRHTNPIPETTIIGCFHFGISIMTLAVVSRQLLQILWIRCNGVCVSKTTFSVMVWAYRAEIIDDDVCRPDETTVRSSELSLGLLGFGFGQLNQLPDDFPEPS